VKARARPNFRDPGAFDDHGFLARLKIDGIGSLRSGELLLQSSCLNRRRRLYLR
jgi:hypothetical protein